MHLILPLGGLGTRLLPHTRNVPKCLIRLAGDTVLGHVLASLASLPISRTTLIVRPDGGQVEDWLRRSLALGGGRHRGFAPGELTFVIQAEPRGQSAALALLGDALRGESLIVFADTLFAIDWRCAWAGDDGLDGHLFVARVADPSALGVALLHPDGTVAGLVEKPRDFVSDLAVMGLYHLRDGAALARAVGEQLAGMRRGPVGVQVEDGQPSGAPPQGEAFLVDALSRMIAGGARFGALAIEGWEDCGDRAQLLQAHRWLLERSWESDAPPGGPDWLRDPSELARAFPDCVFLPPVAIAPDAELSGSVIGPEVAIGPGAAVAESVVGPQVLIEPGAEVEGSLLGPFVSLGAAGRCLGARLSDCVVGLGAELLEVAAEESLLSPGARARGGAARLDLGEEEACDDGA